MKFPLPLLALLPVLALAEPGERFGELIFEDDFERTESQEERDEPGNGWTTSRTPTDPGPSAGREPRG